MNLTLWNSRTLNYWENLYIQSFSQPCQLISEQIIHDHNSLYSVALMDSACAEAQKSRYSSTVHTNVTWASKPDVYMAW
jgi:predicted phosphatase